jgi:pyrroline-5-carboxylate reductase
MKYQWGFIGCGNMGGTLVRAVVKKTKSSEIAVCDLDESKTNALANTCGVVVENAETLAQESRFLVLGVKPQTMEKTLIPLRDKIKRGTVLVTMAAGVSIERLRSYVGDFPVIRIMPNTPAVLGEGVILYCSDGVDEREEDDFVNAFYLG